MRRVYILIFFLIFSGSLWAADGISFYPTNWWVGMKDPSLQLMIRDISWVSPPSVTLSYPGVQLVKITPAENPHYLFLDLRISPQARPGMLKIHIRPADGTEKVIDFPLLARRAGKSTVFAQGVTSADFIYFLMPDRWSNGDPGNDRVPGMRDQSLNRDSIFLRHGGDMQGIINHLDYLQGLGVTTLWMTPVLENDMPDRTEHGYAFTDHYTIEPRFGGAPLYKKLSDELHRRGMKLIQDAVYNHVGSYHFIVQDAPSKNWLHQWPSFTQTSYRDQPLMDPYASAADRRITSDGWFTTQMPDINQGDPYVANFLIQHAIWCVETFGVDGWRIDTYIYNDLAFMNRCNKALTDEYPRLTMFGEAWVHGTANQAFFVENNLINAYKSNLQGAVDFQCNFYGILPALMEKAGWTDGVIKLYNTLSNDFLYKDPMRNVIFLDNHDMSRIFSQVGESVAKQKTGIKWLLTCRGIPQMYYGTEILMKGFANPDGWVRLDFPGGWVGDKKNAFTGEGLSVEELEVQKLTRTLGQFRRSSSALRTGKMMQYVPKKGLYVYFRYDTGQTILCAMNTDSTTARLNPADYSERTSGFRTATDILSGEQFPLTATIDIPSGQMSIMELKK
ncbi:MAG: cyclomaltodextrinase N-terminal domain-containing protein [Chitinophagaceae bacterium]|nr:cyclomaltodextrinase N-terminal domain-containing protein [Chitinophagaceae bacterium]